MLRAQGVAHQTWVTSSEEKNILKDTSCISSFKCWSYFMFAKIWVQHDQGGGDRTCFQTLRLVLPHSPGPWGRRRTQRRSNLRMKSDVTNYSDKRDQTL